MCHVNSSRQPLISWAHTFTECVRAMPWQRWSKGQNGLFRRHRHHRRFILFPHFHPLPLELSQCQEVEKRQGSSLAGWPNRIWVQMWLHCVSQTHIKDMQNQKLSLPFQKVFFSRLSVRVYLGRVLQFSDPIVGNTLYYILSECKRCGGRSEIFLLFTPEKRVNFRLPLPPLFAQGSCSLSQSQLICQSCPCQLTIQRTNLKVLKSLLLN